MVRIAVFEDNEDTHVEIDEALKQGGHEIVGRAWNISEAHRLLTHMAVGDVVAEYSLVDGTLATTTHGTPDFIFQPQGERTIKKRNFRGKVSTKSVPLEPVVIAPTGRVIGQHGRQITSVIDTLKIPTMTIGISSDPAQFWEGRVDHDLTKSRIRSGLLNLITSIEATRR